MYQLAIYFPKQQQDYKELGRTIRSNFLFKQFLTNKSKDFRTLTFTFPTETQKEVVSELLIANINNLGYKIEIK